MFGRGWAKNRSGFKMGNGPRRCCRFAGLETLAFIVILIFAQCCFCQSESVPKSTEDRGKTDGAKHKLEEVLTPPHTPNPERHEIRSRSSVENAKKILGLLETHSSTESPAPRPKPAQKVFIFEDNKHGGKHQGPKVIFAEDVVPNERKPKADKSPVEAPVAEDLADEKSTKRSKSSSTISDDSVSKDETQLKPTQETQKEEEEKEEKQKQKKVEKEEGKKKETGKDKESRVKFISDTEKITEEETISENEPHSQAQGDKEAGSTSQDKDSGKEDPKENISERKDKGEKRAEKGVDELDTDQNKKSNEPRDLPEKADQYVKSAISKDKAEAREKRPELEKSAQDIVEIEVPDEAYVREKANILTALRRKVHDTVESKNVDKVSDKSDLNDVEKKVEEKVEEEEQTQMALDEMEHR
ncbi:cilia- and flagella-associated protein 251-like [Penaeus indicus]|uniref:cilia- and flagella-associated protein 251-like n=1 Tax=Penaeus indicus TaxID=29960 RepID=UPI00300CEAE5